MTTKRVFVIKNQFDQYLDKHSGWHSGKDANALFRVDYHDQALNTLLEVNSKDIELRGRIIEVDMDDKKRPVVEISEAALALDKSSASTGEAIPENGDEDNDNEADEPEEIEETETPPSLFEDLDD